jgi:hypothetical protein
VSDDLVCHLGYGQCRPLQHAVPLSYCFPTKIHLASEPHGSSVNVASSCSDQQVWLFQASEAGMGLKFAVVFMIFLPVLICWIYVNNHILKGCFCRSRTDYACRVWSSVAVCFIRCHNTSGVCVLASWPLHIGQPLTRGFAIRDAPCCCSHGHARVFFKFQ